MIGQILLYAAVGGEAIFLAVLAFATIEESLRHRR